MWERGLTCKLEVWWLHGSFHARYNLWVSKGPMIYVSFLSAACMRNWWNFAKHISKSPWHLHTTQQDCCPRSTTAWLSGIPEGCFWYSVLVSRSRLHFLHLLSHHPEGSFLIISLHFAGSSSISALCANGLPSEEPARILPSLHTALEKTQKKACHLLLEEMLADLKVLLIQDHWVWFWLRVLGEPN